MSMDRLFQVHESLPRLALRLSNRLDWRAKEVFADIGLRVVCGGFLATEMQLLRVYPFPEVQRGPRKRP